ncbi:MAG: hypothetical protein ACNYPE_14050 [Candidatus Azotimanducaceae bacterium WSBS_2022_MAG_OTU7]
MKVRIPLLFIPLLFIPLLFIPLLFNPLLLSKGKVGWQKMQHGIEDISPCHLQSRSEGLSCPTMNGQITKRFSNPVNPLAATPVAASWLGYYFFVES